MKFLSLQLIVEKDVRAFTLFFLWICNIGIVIQNTGNRTDVFLTAGVMPLSVSLSFGLTHFF